MSRFTLFRRQLENEPTPDILQALLLLFSMLVLAVYSWNSTLNGYRLFISDGEIAAAIMAACVHLLFAITLTRRGGARWLVPAALLGMFSVFGSSVILYKIQAGYEVLAAQPCHVTQQETKTASERAHMREMADYGVRVSHTIASVESQAITPIREVLCKLELDMVRLNLEANAEETGLGGRLQGRGNMWHAIQQERARTNVAIHQAQSALKEHETLFNWVRKTKTPDEQYARLLEISTKLSVPVVVPEVQAPDAPARNHVTVCLL